MSLARWSTVPAGLLTVGQMGLKQSVPFASVSLVEVISGGEGESWKTEGG